MEYFEGVRRIESWKTPCQVPAGERGNARVIIESQPPGYYRFKEMWGGWITYEALDTFYYTSLQDRDPAGEWKTWMTDQPQWWFAMDDIAQESRGGHYLIGGLGLGIIVHQLARRPNKVKTITIVEKSQDVIDLVLPHLPDPFHMSVIQDDFWEWADPERSGSLPNYDVIITDMWRGDRKSEAVMRAVARTHFVINQRWPESQQFYHGMDRYACDLGVRRLNMRKAPEDGSLHRKYAGQMMTRFHKGE